MQRIALGKGLGALIPEVRTEDEGEVVRELRVSEVKSSPYQPRKRFDEEKQRELAASIRERGVIQPILVRSTGEGYELIAGERRLLAAKEAGLDRVPAIVREVPDNEALEIALVENIQRQELNPIEEAEAYQRLINEFKLTQEDLSKQVGKDRASIANSLRLLKLPQDIQDEVIKNRISMGHARTLLALEGEDAQRMACDRVVKKGLSVRETESLVKRMKEENVSRETLRPPQLDVAITSCEERLMLVLGTKVKIKQEPKGNGKIEIEFYSPEDLMRVMERLERKPGLSGIPE